ncbi:MAG: phosphoglycerate mutase family protein [Acinetobacter sp.]|nr:phosphoglycerate mutase family protein [Acinetobacter sp.]
MYLTLIRHGEAHPAVNGDDIKRPLTERGHLQAEQTAQAIKDDLKPDVFVVSPLLRAQQTLAHLQAYFPDVPVLICNDIKPDDDAHVAIEWLSHLDYQSVVVVCHMNVVGYMDQLLCQHPFHGFALAEARRYEQAVIAESLSRPMAQFVPVVD